MNTLSLDLFTLPGIDFEVRQYHILDSLKRVYQKFRENRLYPHLAEVIDIYQSLQNIQTQIQNLEDGMPRLIREIDITNQKIKFELLNSDDNHLDVIRNIIRWALPIIKKTIDEGTSIFEFVDENIELQEVGILPSYKQEGYIFVPDKNEKTLQIFRFEFSVYSGGKDHYRILKTHYLRSIDESRIKGTLNNIKIDLIRENKELPNPATYSVDTQLDFDFSDTIFPVVKRKFVRHLAS